MSEEFAEYCDKNSIQKRHSVRAIPNKSVGFGVTVPHTGPVLGMGASGAGARIWPGDPARMVRHQRKPS